MTVSSCAALISEEMAKSGRRGCEFKSLDLHQFIYFFYHVTLCRYRLLFQTL